MGSCCGKDTCPTHPGNSFQKICVRDTCLEPLCSICVNEHMLLHEKLGFPHKIEPYKQVNKQFNRKTKFDNEDKNTLIHNVTPTSLLIKQYTKEYFQKAKQLRKSQSKSVRILEDLQIWKQVGEDPNFTKKMNDFFRDNLNANKAIVGDKFQHLY